MSATKAERPAWIGDALEQHEPSLLRYALRLTGDSEVARDLVQDTFLRLCQSDDDTLSSRLPEWLYVVCRNKAIDRRRRESRWRRLFASRPEPLRQKPALSPAEELERRQVLQRILALLDELPPRQAQVLRLRFREGLSYREIALKEGLSVSNVGYLIHVGMRSLREEMRQGGLDGSG